MSGVLPQFPVKSNGKPRTRLCYFVARGRQPIIIHQFIFIKTMYVYVYIYIFVQRVCVCVCVCIPPNESKLYKGEEEEKETR